MAWNELVKMALLGTEKLPLQTAVLPTKIREIVEKSPENDRETAFLKAAALTWLYEKAGQKPDHTPLPDIAREFNGTSIRLMPASSSSMSIIREVCGVMPRNIAISGMASNRR